MTGLPKKYAKMGFKRGWRAFKATKSKTRSVSTMAKKKTYRSPKRDIMSKARRPIVGAAGTVLYESVISPMIPVQGDAKNILEFIGGLAMSQRGGIVGATGQTLAVINAYQLMAKLAKMVIPATTGAVATHAANSFR